MFLTSLKTPAMSPAHTNVGTIDQLRSGFQSLFEVPDTGDTQGTLDLEPPTIGRAASTTRRRHQRVWRGSTAAQRGTLGGIRKAQVMAERRALQGYVAAEKLSDAWDDVNTLRQSETVGRRAFMTKAQKTASAKADIVMEMLPRSTKQLNYSNYN
jgi:hypothetical protein